MIGYADVCDVKAQGPRTAKTSGVLATGPPVLDPIDLHEEMARRRRGPLSCVVACVCIHPSYLSARTRTHTPHTRARRARGLSPRLFSF